jgi:hypothetical protein
MPEVVEFNRRAKNGTLYLDGCLLVCFAGAAGSLGYAYLKTKKIPQD